jgi:TonB family protein
MLESYLIAVGIKSTVVLAAALAGLRLLRGRDAAVRHLVCLLALISAAAVPLLALWSPDWSYPISVGAAPSGAASLRSALAGSLNWPVPLAAIWLLGSFVLLVRAAGGWVVLRRVRSRSTHFQQGLGAEIRLADVSTPLTCWALRPVILLPRNARGWDEPRLRAVLLHESAHVRRHDCVAKHIGQVARALLWWNPLVWMLAARLAHEQELACDGEVLAAGVPADIYANVLLDVAREVSGSLSMGCAMASHGAAALRERFTHLFEWRPETGHSARKTAIAIPLLLIAMTTVSFAEKIYKIGPGIVPPKVLEKSEPQYTDKARAARLEGTVALMIVVGVDERAHNIKVTKSLDPGMDANAIKSIMTWRFQPGTKNGKPVPVQAKIDVNFRLH